MRLAIDLDDLKDLVDLVEVVGATVTLKRQGTAYMGLCPFHNEKSASFMVRKGDKHYHCFGCSEHGDVFDFIQKTQGVDLEGAIRLVAERAGVPIEESPEDKARAAEHQRLYDLNAAAALRYNALLLGKGGEAPRRYLEERGITEESVRHFGLGWAPETDRELAERLISGGYSGQDLLTAGIMVRPKDGGNARPTFQGRLLFPVRDGRGRVCGFSARLLGKGQPKYINTPGTPIYQKGRLLFGLDLAQDALRKAGAVVVEGYVDVVRAHQCGYKNIVGVGGTAITVEQLLLLKRCKRITLALDGDLSGQQAQIKAGLAGQTAFAKDGKDVALHVAVLPAEHDPDSLLAQDPLAFGTLISDAPLLMEHYYHQVHGGANRDHPAWRQGVLDTLRPHLAPLSFGLRAHYVRRLSADLEIEEGRLWTELEGHPPGQAGAGPSNGHQQPPPKAAPKTAPRRAPVPPAWLPRIQTGDAASVEAALTASWREGLRRAEEYALGVLLAHAPLTGDLLELTRMYEPGTPALEPYFQALARGAVPDGTDAERLAQEAARWPAVPVEMAPPLVLSALRRAGVERLRLAAHEGQASAQALAGVLAHREETA